LRIAAEPALHSLVWRGGSATWVPVADVPAGAAKTKGAQKGSAKQQAADQPAQTAAGFGAAVAADPVAQAGREKFNDTCSHCHSPDGASPMRERDLRRLKMRYDDKWVDTAVKTINEGRPQLGMPTWKGQLSEQEIDRIVTFLRTIQK
jgi:mono/diheme cytochrome c family protein